MRTHSDRFLLALFCLCLIVCLEPERVSALINQPAASSTSDKPLVHHRKRVSASTVTESIYYTHLDRQGSIVALTDADGAMAHETVYAPSGKIRYETGHIVTRFGFTGEAQGTADGLWYLRARHYAPQLGRMLQRDTVHVTQCPHRFVYVCNNAPNLADPSGHEPVVHRVTQNRGLTHWLRDNVIFRNRRHLPSARGMSLAEALKQVRPGHSAVVCTLDESACFLHNDLAFINKDRKVEFRVGVGRDRTTGRIINHKTGGILEVNRKLVLADNHTLAYVVEIPPNQADYVRNLLRNNMDELVGQNYVLPGELQKIIPLPGVTRWGKCTGNNCWTFARDQLELLSKIPGIRFITSKGAKHIVGLIPVVGLGTGLFFATQEAAEAYENGKGILGIIRPYGCLAIGEIIPTSDIVICNLLIDNAHAIGEGLRAMPAGYRTPIPLGF